MAEESKTYTIFSILCERIILVALIFVLGMALNVEEFVLVSAKETGSVLISDTLYHTESSLPVAGKRVPKRTQWVVMTAYTLDIAETDDTPCIPASGEDLCTLRKKNGFNDTIAANFLQLGTQIKIPDVFGDKVFVARDRMNPRYNGTSRADILLDSKAEARAFGVKYVKIEIY